MLVPSLAREGLPALQGQVCQCIFEQACQGKVRQVVFEAKSARLFSSQALQGNAYFRGKVRQVIFEPSLARDGPLGYFRGKVRQ
eukprot:12215486-Heterocapsa_arctica.AAC.1